MAVSDSYSALGCCLSGRRTLGSAADVQLESATHGQATLFYLRPTNHTSTAVSTSEHNSGSRDAGGAATRSPIFGIWFGVVLVIATLLRTYKLGNKSFWLDEAASNMLARSDWHTFLNALVHRQANMTLYYLVLRGWMHLGNSEALVRLLSVLFGVASIPLMYQLAAYIFGQRRPGLLHSC